MGEKGEGKDNEWRRGGGGKGRGDEGREGR